MIDKYMFEQLDSIEPYDPHYDAAQYILEHADALTLYDADCWFHLIDLTGWNISYEAYHKVNETCGEMDYDIQDLTKKDLPWIRGLVFIADFEKMIDTNGGN